MRERDVGDVDKGGILKMDAEFGRCIKQESIIARTILCMISTPKTSSQKRSCHDLA